MREFSLGRVAIVAGLVLASSVISVQAGKKERKVDKRNSQSKGSAQNGKGKADKSPARNGTDTADTILPGTDYQIGPGDVLAVDVWKEPEITHTVTVRPDGKISLPLVGDLVATGLTPKQVESEVSEKLQTYLSAPQVTVIVSEVKSQRVNVVGEVAKPSSYPLVKPMTILDAIAVAGGLQEFAKVRKIYVLRVGPNGRFQRFPFNYKDVINGKNLDQNIELESHDTVVVP